MYSTRIGYSYQLWADVVIEWNNICGDPLKSKLFIALALGYVLSPIDLIPDSIPLLGQLDDLLIVPALIALALKPIPNEVLDESQQLRMKKRFGAVTALIPLFWFILVIWLIRILLKLS
ncbi:MAG TPA: hypothetical protein DIT29_00185 [Pseudothermotoga sp.]|nr:DUF1232 domain-containing protein [Pseudothermotoga sp.]HBT39465.1 hypothetical protein [Pseudothermotoga sp.]HCO97132.1 hypothetical protein [Pseudothermotoga sp.]